MYELYTGESLLPEAVDQMLVPSFHVALFDKYPDSLLDRGKYRHFFFNTDGECTICYIAVQV